MNFQVYLIDDVGRVTASDGDLLGQNHGIGELIDQIFPILEHLDIKELCSTHTSLTLPGVAGHGPLPEDDFFDFCFSKNDDQPNSWKLLIQERTAYYLELQQQQQARNERLLSDNSFD